MMDFYGKHFNKMILITYLLSFVFLMQYKSVIFALFISVFLTMAIVPVTLIALLLAEEIKNNFVSFVKYASVAFALLAIIVLVLPAGSCTTSHDEGGICSGRYCE